MRDEYACVLPFDTDTGDFARGFEAGRIWEMLKRELVMLDGQPFHSTNVEMVLRMLDSLGIKGLTAEFTSDPEWMVLRESDDA